MGKEIWEWGKAILIAIGLAFIIRTFGFATSVVEGASMYPALENGERVIFNKAIYLFSEPDRGDIVIIQRPIKNYVKRVIGLPNDTIEVKDRVLYINGVKHDQPYLDSDAIRGTGDFGPIQVPDGRYFVMGDNRSISKDSRNGLGFIKDEEIIGRSELIVFPFDEFSLTR
ncbi:signal peptidase I [Salirhabdus euzebyi]|uniref:Signal peptidase I n=1 Tax=Salirhabdus euzebyi TaxID=394506 RepID=A0A841Q9A1_9BACI|nr:signal peptidase I [Salirhabdus euzebyi]MBB6454837.1 signal peptidase I [Salirhabdus euzebyi]